MFHSCWVILASGAVVVSFVFVVFVVFVLSRDCLVVCLGVACVQVKAAGGWRGEREVCWLWLFLYLSRSFSYSFGGFGFGTSGSAVALAVKTHSYDNV